MKSTLLTLRCMAHGSSHSTRRDRHEEGRAKSRRDPRRSTSESRASVAELLRSRDAFMSALSLPVCGVARTILLGVALNPPRCAKAGHT